MTHINTKQPIRIINLSHAYEGVSRPLFTGFSMDIFPGWTGIAGRNGSGKTTLLKLVSNIIPLQSGQIQLPGSAYYCRQETDITMDEAEDFFYPLFDRDSNAGKLSALLEIGFDWFYRLETLSEGEKKRLQIAIALFKDPDVLAVDEPVNHVDEGGRRIITEVLKNFRGTGLIVSHDSLLLDSLCMRTIFIENSNARLRNGGFSKAMVQIGEENADAGKKYRKIKRQLDNLISESARRRRIADNSDIRRSKRGISRKDHDAKSRKDLARITGKDAVGGRLLSQMEGRIRHAEKRLSEIDVPVSFRTGITIASEISKKDLILYEAEGTILIGDKKLYFPELTLSPGEKVALTGKNGSGKTTLISHLLQNPSLTEQEVLYIPQEPGRTCKNQVLQEIELLSRKERGEVYSIFSRLGSEPANIMESLIPSPGEWKKLMISMGIRKNPVLIVLDEPTNHMDLISVRELSSALCSIECAMLVISHDTVFREQTVQKEWHIIDEEERNILKKEQ